MIDLKQVKNIEDIINSEYWIVNINIYDYDWERDEYYAFTSIDDANDFVKKEKEEHKKNGDKFITYLDKCTFDKMLEYFTLDKLSYLFGLDLEDLLTLALQSIRGNIK